MAAQNDLDLGEAALEFLDQAEALRRQVGEQDADADHVRLEVGDPFGRLVRRQPVIDELLGIALLGVAFGQHVEDRHLVAMIPQPGSKIGQAQRRMAMLALRDHAVAADQAAARRLDEEDLTDHAVGPKHQRRSSDFTYGKAAKLSTTNIMNIQLLPNTYFMIWLFYIV